jgi:hypothetical protein
MAGVSWFAGLALLAVALAGGLNLMPGGAEASPGHFDEGAALDAASEAASGYLDSTIGSDHTNGDGSVSRAVSTGEGPISLDQMERVDFRFESDVRDLAASPDSQVGFEDEKDVWVASWELGGVYSVTSGENDGTAYVVVVIEDGTGELLTASAGVREAERQAKVR